MKWVMDQKWHLFFGEEENRNPDNNPQGGLPEFQLGYAIARGAWAPVFEIWEDSSWFGVDANLFEFANSEVRVVAGSDEYRFKGDPVKPAHCSRNLVWPSEMCPFHSWLLALPGSWGQSEVTGRFVDGQLSIRSPKNTDSAISIVEVQVGFQRSKQSGARDASISLVSHRSRVDGAETK